MKSWYDYPNCNDAERHMQEGREDARQHSRQHQPSSWDEQDCQQAYADARREEQGRIERRDEEQAQLAQWEQQYYEESQKELNENP